MVEVLKKEFNVKVLGRITFALGISFEWYKGGVKLSQRAYILKVAEKFRVDKANPTKLPLQKGFQTTIQDSPVEEKDKMEMKAVPF